MSEFAKQYHRQTQIDPLFSWPGVNLADMGIAIETLKKSRDEIVSITGKQYSPEITERVQRALYPTTYLREMLQLETQRRKLTEGATFADLETYQAQLLVTIRSYQDYLDMLIPDLEKTAKEQTYKGLQYHFGRSSFKHFLSVLHLYRSDVDDVMLKTVHRWDCANNTSSECTHDSLPDLVKATLHSMDTRGFQSDAANIISSIRVNSKLYGNPDRPSWAVTTSHRCYSKYSEVYYFLWELDLGEGVPIWKADVVNDVLVHDHQVTAETTNQYELMLKKSGAKGYVLQPHTTQYACPDLAADTGLIRSMSYVYKTLKAIDWVPLEDNQSDLHIQYAELQNDAEVIAELSYLSEPLIQNFMRDLNILLNSQAQEGLSGLWGESQQQTLEGMALTYRNKTYNLSRDIMALAYGNTAIGDYVTRIMDKR